MDVKEIQDLAERTRAGKRAVESWRFRNRSEVSVDDRVFLLQQGKNGPAIIGYGSVRDVPQQDRRGTWFANIDFDLVVDPETAPLLGRAHLLRMNEGRSIWKTQASGVKLPDSVAHDLEELIVGSGRKPPVNPMDEFDDEGLIEAPEGRIVIRKHTGRERNRRIVESKLRESVRKYGRLTCEVCAFDFSDRYGERGKGFIECHHTKPIATLKEGQRTKVADLALVCSNCHRMIHRWWPWLSIAQVRKLIEV
jgi:hypothetical protein